MHNTGWPNCKSYKKSHTTYCNWKRQFLLKWNTFNLDGTVSYLMQYMYCSKDTISSKHQHSQPFIVWNTTCYSKQNFPVPVSKQNRLWFYPRQFIGLARGGERGHGPPKCLENIVILCFERRFPKQNSVIHLKSSILAPKKIFGPLKFLGWLRHWVSFLYFVPFYTQS